MAKGAGQKRKILLIYQYLVKNSDEEHVVTLEMLQKMLLEHEIKAERKGLYDDLHTLEEFGVDLVRQKGRKAGYYIASRDFELPELKLLMDIIQSARFLTPKKSTSLVTKLSGLCSVHQAKQLRNRAVRYSHTKSENESIYYAIDHLYSAIAQNLQVSFRYMRWKLDFSAQNPMVQCDNKVQPRCISPWALLWSDENYYLIGFDAENGGIRHYRVDRMREIEILSEERQGKTLFEAENEGYIQKTFGMFRGDDECVRLLCENDLIGVMIERFGKNIMPIPYVQDTGKFTFYVRVAISDPFYGWLCGFNGKVCILAPENVRKESIMYLESLQESWKSALSDN